MLLRTGSQRARGKRTLKRPLNQDTPCCKHMRKLIYVKKVHINNWIGYTLFNFAPRGLVFWVGKGSTFHVRILYLVPEQNPYQVRKTSHIWAQYDILYKKRLMNRLHYSATHWLSNQSRSAIRRQHVITPCFTKI